ncbi:MAG: apolipoprotein N-acyltransferase, partial [Oceanobacter sp.]
MQLLKSELRTEWSARSPRAAAIVAFIAGCLFPLALAPFYWWPFGLISLAGFILCLLPSNTAKAAFNRAWSFSFGQFLVGVSWVYVSMHDYGGTPMWAAAILVAIFAAALALVPATLFTVWQKYFSRAFPVLTLGAFWFLSEWFRSWFLTGFPWLFAGDGHIQTWLAGWIPLLGSYGVSLILFFSAAVLIKATQKQNLWMLIFLLAWPIGLFLKDVEWTESIGQIQVSAVQGNINQNEKWKPEMIGPTIQRYRRETEKLWDSDLILWPETAVTLLYNRFLPFLEELADEARQHDSAIITGIPYQHPESSPNAGAFHNSILAFGAAEGLYHKQRLVPFGEYIPLEQQIRGLIPFLDLPMSSFSPGASNQPLLKAEANGQLYFIAPFICYEI